ncbi:MAG: hypothetical protein ACJ75H_00120 [Thermoanaerobaculia bacterium]
MYREKRTEPFEPAGKQEDRAVLRRQQLDRLLSYKGAWDLDLDQETLERLRSTP